MIPYCYILCNVYFLEIFMENFSHAVTFCKNQDGA